MKYYRQINLQKLLIILFFFGCKHQKENVYLKVKNEIIILDTLYEQYKILGTWPETPEKIKGWIGIRYTFPSDVFFLTPEELKIQENYEKAHGGMGILAPELVTPQVLMRPNPNYPDSDPADYLIIYLNEFYPEEANYEKEQKWK